jgi:hypothetical protein
MFVAIGELRGRVAAQCSCSPMEQRSWGTQNIVFDGSPFYEDFWIQSAGMWTGTFEGTNVSVHVGAASGNQWRVKLDYSLVGVAWADTYDGWIRINPDTLAQSDTFIKNTISHEIGETPGDWPLRMLGVRNERVAAQPGDPTNTYFPVIQRTLHRRTKLFGADGQ